MGVLRPGSGAAADGAPRGCGAQSCTLAGRRAALRGRATLTLIYLIAGEPSGDVLGAGLMAALRRLRPDVTFRGLGGPRMAEQGLHSLFPIDELALMGIFEVLPKMARLSGRLRQVTADIRAHRPAVVVTIDTPGFTLRILHRLRGAGLPRVHYVAPQVWAWRQGRVKRFPGLWEALLCLLPFEPAFFAAHGLAATFVGHPVTETPQSGGDGAAFRARHGVAAGVPVLLLLPGSRRGEVTRLLPRFDAALALLRRDLPGLIPVIVVASGVAGAVRAATVAWPGAILLEDAAERPDAYAAATAALTKSGTSTLELAAAGVPMVATYRGNPITAAIVHRIAKVRFYTLVNLLAGREVIPELMQWAGTPEALADATRRLLTDAAARAAQRASFAAVLASLRPPAGAPSDVAAAAVIGAMAGRS